MPPLGLDAKDPREQARQQLNRDILNSYYNYGANASIDLDKAVRSSTDASKLDPAYLSGSVLNNAYHDRLAQATAEAIKNIPFGGGL